MSRLEDAHLHSLLVPPYFFRENEQHRRMHSFSYLSSCAQKQLTC